jgi:hypothetical protein
MKSAYKRIEIISTSVGEHLLSYAINGDASGLNDAEIREFDDFQNALIEEPPEGYSFGHFSLGEEEGFKECAVSGFADNCYTLDAIFFHKNA